MGIYKCLIPLRKLMEQDTLQFSHRTHQTVPQIQVTLKVDSLCLL